MKKVFKNFYLKGALCVALAVCVLVSVFMPITGLLANANPAEAKMLHIKSTDTATSSKALLQRVSVEAGKVYHFTFGLSDSISGFNAVCLTDGSRKAFDASIAQVSKEDKGGSTIYTYSYTIPASFNGSKLFFGVELSGNIDGYFFSASVYDSADANKAELLANPNFSDALNEWSWDWDAWFGHWDDAASTEWSYKKTTIKIVDYDETLLGISSSGGSENQPKGKMLYIKSTGMKELIQRVRVAAGETYHFTFGLSNTIRNFNAVCYTDGIRSSFDADIKQVSKEDKGGSTVYTYSYTVPQNFSETLLFFGVKATGAQEGYLFGVSVYKASDESKTELLSNADFEIGLDDWALGWDAWFGTTTSTGTDKGLTEWNNTATTLKIVDYDEDVLGFGSSSGGNEGVKMLHLQSNAPKVFYQRIKVTVGTSYIYNFSVSDSLGGFKLRADADGIRPGIDINEELISKQDKGGYTNYSYKFTVPATANDSSAMTDVIFLGIQPSGATDGYMFGFSVYEDGDASKTELYSNPDFSIGLDDWAYGWDAWFGTTTGSGTAKGLTEWSNSSATLKIVDFDESLLGGGSVASGEKMLHFQSSAPKVLYQRISVKVGTSYIYNFSVSDSLGSFKLRADADGIRPGIDINEELVSKQDKGGYTNYSYKFTVPATANDSSAMTDVIFIGIQPSGATDGYVFGFSVYEDGDTNKTELYSNPDFKIGLDNWAYGWDAWFGTTTGSGTEKGLTEWSNNGTTLTIVDFDESLFGGGSVASGEKMLYFKSAAPKVLYQRIEAKVGKSYIYSFAASKSIGDFNIVATTDGIRNGITINEELVSEQEKSGYSVYTYKFTVPATSNDGSPMTDVIFIGMQPIAGADGYLFGFSVYEDGDANKTELYSNPDFKIGLDNWAYGWDAWFGTSTGSGTEKGLTEWSNNSATLKIVDYDESLLGKTDDTPKQMLYFVNGANTRQFGYRVKVEPSETYCLEFSLFSTSDTSLQVCENGLRATIAVENEVEVTTEENYKKYKYTFTMPDELKADTYFIGPQIYYYSEGYIFDMLLYKADDTKKKNMYPNAELKVGLDGWIWGWSAWFGSNTESGLKEWTDGIITLKLMDFDTSKIDALIALLTSNDGEWWSPDDLLKESDENIANVKGTLVDQNGKAMPDVKLEFISEENTLVTATDSKGEFEFANFEGGFYELYVIDSNGNRRNTGYFSNFFNGDEVTLKLVCDSSDIEVESEITNNDDSQSTDNTTDTEETPKEEKSVGIIKGKVYTPQLKTVSDLKIFMRGVGETVTDKDGAFVFNDIPVGEYEVYTVLDDGKEYVFRTVDVKENVELSVKLKYDVSANASVEEEADFNFVWIIIPIVAVIVAAGVAVIIILKKKSAKK